MVVSDTLILIVRLLVPHGLVKRNVKATLSNHRIEKEGGVEALVLSYQSYLVDFYAPLSE